MSIADKFKQKPLLFSLLGLLIFTTGIYTSGCGSRTEPTVPLPDSAPDSAPEFREIDPIALADAMPPISLSIPDIELETDVTSMGWRIVDQEGTATTEWAIPYDMAGWHVTSAGAGSQGNVVISGHQVIGEAVFAQIALDEVEEGQHIYLTAEDEQVYVYEVTTVAEPIPLVGATEDEASAAQAFVAPTEDAQLTLVTGWPDFSTTHYLFVTAELVGGVDSN